MEEDLKRSFFDFYIFLLKEKIFKRFTKLILNLVLEN